MASNTDDQSSLLFLPTHEIRSKLALGETTSVGLVGLFLDQIERHNHAGLGLNAIVSACPRDIAVAQAKRLDEERSAGRIRSKLHGIPIIIKVGLFLVFSPLPFSKRRRVTMSPFPDSPGYRLGLRMQSSPASPLECLRLWGRMYLPVSGRGETRL